MDVMHSGIFNLNNKKIHPQMNANERKFLKTVKSFYLRSLAFICGKIKKFLDVYY